MCINIFEKWKDPVAKNGLVAKMSSTDFKTPSLNSDRNSRQIDDSLKHVDLEKKMKENEHCS